MTTISIVTPCLNSLATLQETLDSVRAQTYRHVEHIVVDGGSTDGSLELLRRCKDIRLIAEPDSGLSDAVNKGIRHASGDVIGWLNADDIYFPRTLETVAQAFDASPGTAWVTGRCRIINESSEEIRRAVTWYKNFFLRRYSARSHLVQNFVSCPATFVSRQVFADIAYLDEKLRYAMDYDLFLRLGRLAPPVFIDQELAAFRMIDGTLSMSNFEKQFVENFEVAKRYGVEDPLALLANRSLSRTIILIYTMLRFSRSRRRLATAVEA